MAKSTENKPDKKPLEKILWLDMEMTGLDVEKEVVIEVAAIITDLDFNELDQYQTVVKQPGEYLTRMDDWNQRQHRESGLLAKIPDGKLPVDAENDLCAITQKHFVGEPAVIAGNSIYQDRMFIKKYFVNLERLLHYRMLDVSSWKLILREKYHYEYEKMNRHRAIDDIRESISEMQAYLDYFKPHDHTGESGAR